jgi:PAS domain S-box-containing protein
VEFFDDIPIGYVLFDEKGVIREISRPARQLLGMDHRILIGMPLAVVVLAEDVPLFLDHLKRCRVTADHPVRTELRLRSRARTGSSCELVSTVFREKDRRTFRTAIVDLTKRKELERELRRAKDYAERVFEFVPEPLLVLDSDLIVVSANVAFREMTHCSTRQTDGVPLDQLEYVRWDTPEVIAACVTSPRAALLFRTARAK